MGKKDFGSLKSPIGNTALNFISADPIADVDQEEVKKVVEDKKIEEVDTSNTSNGRRGHRRPGRPKLKETRSQRVVLLLKPSLFEKVLEKAEAMDVSVNELYENLMIEYLDNEK